MGTRRRKVLSPCVDCNCIGNVHLHRIKGSALFDRRKRGERRVRVISLSLPLFSWKKRRQCRRDRKKTLCSSSRCTYAQKADSDHDECNEGGQPATHSMAKRTEDVGADHVRDGGREKGCSLFPVACVHRVHHPKWKRRLEDRDACIRERQGACRDQDVRVTDQRQQRRSLLVLLRDLRLQHQQLQHCPWQTATERRVRPKTKSERKREIMSRSAIYLSSSSSSYSHAFLNPSREPLLGAGVRQLALSLYHSQSACSLSCPGRRVTRSALPAFLVARPMHTGSRVDGSYDDGKGSSRQ